MKSKQVSLRIALVAAALAAGAPHAYAQKSFPSRPIELVVPFAPGGGSGITAEIIKKVISDEKLSPQPVNITYKPGASGQVGWTYLATRKRDAHTIATSTQSFSYGLAQKTMQVGPEAFTPIALMLEDTQLMATHPQSGLKSMKDLIEKLMKDPKSVKMGGTGSAGSDANLAFMINRAAKVQINYIPFKSGGEVNAAILGGHVDAALGNPNELAGYVQAGKLVPLAVFADQRVPGMADVPTMKEVGYDVVSRSTRGVIAPGGITKQEERVLVEMMRKVTESKGWSEYAEKNMMRVRFLGGEDYAKYLAEERARLADTLKELGKL
jgi:putative tricarboxylic transport membrane protein